MFHCALLKREQALREEPTLFCVHEVLKNRYSGGLNLSVSSPEYHNYENLYFSIEVITFNAGPVH
jgi:hypothetical protein